MILRPYQQRTLDQLYTWWMQRPGITETPIVVMPTGSGKSVVIAELCRLLFDTWPQEHPRTVVLVPSKELAEQNAAKLIALLPHHISVGFVSASLGKKQHNADVIVASDDATFGLPEVERGALGAATHLSRLVPQHMMRRLFFTAATVDAATLHHFGSVHEVVARAELDEAALRVARDIAAKDTRVIRAAKEALNLIDVQRVNSSYRMEQGFTFELNLSGVSDEHRDAFAGTKKANQQ